MEQALRFTIWCQLSHRALALFSVQASEMPKSLLNSSDSFYLEDTGLGVE